MPLDVLILTNSLDQTASELVKIFHDLGVQNVCRWNIDLADKYEIVFSIDGWSITDPLGRCFRVTEVPVALVWRKPFLDQLQGLGDDGSRRYVRSQIDALMLSMVEINRSNGGRFIVEPNSDRKVPKLLQLKVAARYFRVPEYRFSLLKSDEFPGFVVTKSLFDAIVGDNKVLFTTVVEPNELERPFPWFLQSAITGGTDITAVFINGQVNWYACEFSRHEDSVDWRIEINTEHQSPWHEVDRKISEVWDPGVLELMNDLKLSYGRLDFIQDTDGLLWFLEVNPNGEFGWLDDEERSLHKSFAKAVLSISAN